MADINVRRFDVKLSTLCSSRNVMKQLLQEVVYKMKMTLKRFVPLVIMMFMLAFVVSLLPEGYPDSSVMSEQPHESAQEIVLSSYVTQDN